MIYVNGWPHITSERERLGIARLAYLGAYYDPRAVRARALARKMRDDSRGCIGSVPR